MAVCWGFFLFLQSKLVAVDSFYRTHKHLVENTNCPVFRELMDEVDWSHRLIGIKGSRGAGKTAFLLGYAKKYFGTDRSCLYINLNNFYFTRHSIIDFADEFRKKGGKTLLVDQVYKYPDWAKELRYCYDNFPELKIVFSGSSVLRLRSENPYLEDVVHSYNLRGFSFREFLNYEADCDFKSITLSELLENHQSIADEVLQKVKPLAYFQDYIHHGYYPFYLEKSNYSENLLKTMNFMLEIDVSYLKQIELKYLPKLRKLFYILSKNAPCTPNISQLSNEIETSRATVVNYIKYLKDARLFNLLYPVGEDFPKKPSKVYLHNTNLMYVISRDFIDRQALCETFFYNSVHKDHKINAGKGKEQFLVDKRLGFRVDTDHKVRQPREEHYVAVDMLERGRERVIPLWLFGFLY